MRTQATRSCRPATAMFGLSSAHPDFAAKVAGRELLVVGMGMHSEMGLGGVGGAWAFL